MGAPEAAEVVRRALRAMGPDVAVEPRGGTERWRRAGRLFCVLRPLTRRVDVGFSRIGRARSTRILDARAARLPFVRHRVVVEAPGDVDSELLAWLREAYETALDAG